MRRDTLLQNRYRVSCVEGARVLALLYRYTDGWRAKDWGCLYEPTIVLHRAGVEYRLTLSRGARFELQPILGPLSGFQVLFVPNEGGAPVSVNITFDADARFAAEPSMDPPPPAEQIRPTDPDTIRLLGSLIVRSLGRRVSDPSTSSAP